MTAPADVAMAGAVDSRHLLHAVLASAVFMTRNHDDFEDLHQLVQATGGRHTGILAIRFDNNPAREGIRIFRAGQIKNDVLEEQQQVANFVGALTRSSVGAQFVDIVG